jgi:hypothetical protein
VVKPRVVEEKESLRKRLEENWLKVNEKENKYYIILFIPSIFLGIV